VGGYNTVFGYILFSALYFIFGSNLHYSLILFISYLISILNNFIVLKIFVFNTKGNWLGECISTYISYIFLYPINALLLFISIDVYGLSAYFGQLIATIIMPIITYFILKRFAFKKKKSK
jgi:putative flippase GtrA